MMQKVEYVKYILPALSRLLDKYYLAGAKLAFLCFITGIECMVLTMFKKSLILPQG
jgi:hypothetical protein